MKNSFFENQKRVRVRALFVGQRIELRAFEQTQRLAVSPLMVTAGATGCAALFRYGVVVLFGLSSVEEVAFLSGLKPLISEAFEQTESEELDIVLNSEKNEGIDQSSIILHQFSIERLQLVAVVLAKSVVLAHYESTIASSFDRIEPLGVALQSGGGGGTQSKELLRHIGSTLSIHGKMVGRVEVVEKPELLWERPELERLYQRLENEYEVSERHRALERKLDLISRTAETLMGLLHNKRSLRVEWYIVILIAVDIALTLYKMF